MEMYLEMPDAEVASTLIYAPQQKKPFGALRKYIKRKKVFSNGTEWRIHMNYSTVILNLIQMVPIFVQNFFKYSEDSGEQMNCLPFW